MGQYGNNCLQYTAGQQPASKATLRTLKIDRVTRGGFQSHSVAAAHDGMLRLDRRYSVWLNILFTNPSPSKLEPASKCSSGLCGPQSLQQSQSRCCARQLSCHWAASVGRHPRNHVAAQASAVLHARRCLLSPRADHWNFGCCPNGSRGQLSHLDPLRQPVWALASPSASSINATTDLPAIFDLLRHSITMDLGLTCLWLFFGALAAGSLPLLFTITESQLALAAALSAGLLIGAACSVVVPEGFESFRHAAGEILAGKSNAMRSQL